MKLIIQLKSWLNIEPSVGCPNSCVYCFRHADGDFNLRRPRQTVSAKDLFNKLKKHSFFIPNKTHLSINGTKSDAFLTQNKPRTFKLLKLLDQAGYKNWVTIVTKGYIDADDVKKIKKFSNITPVIYVTYSEMPFEFESVLNSRRVESMKNLKEGGIRCILYWRPLIRDVNDSNDQIRKVLSVGEKYADAFVLIGLRLTDEIEKYVKEKGLKLPDENWDPGHKIIASTTKKKIFQQYREQKCKVPLFLRSSCAVSYLEKLPDFNAHWAKPERNCSPFCPFAQQARCQRQSTQKLPEKIKKLIPELTREEKTFYRHKYRLLVK